MSAVGAVRQALPGLQAEVLAQTFAHDASFTIRVPREQRAAVHGWLQDLTRGASHLTELAADDAS